MDLIIARAPTTAEPTRAEDAARDRRLAEHAERLLLAAAEDLVKANRGMEREVRLAAKYGLSQRRIFDLTGIDRRRIKRILDTIED